MKPPRKIINLLNSDVHEDRAIGITLLEQIPEYKKFFKPDRRTGSHCVIMGLKEKSENTPTSRIFSKNHYWIDYAGVHMWIKEMPKGYWATADKDIKI